MSAGKPSRSPLRSGGAERAYEEGVMAAEQSAIKVLVRVRPLLPRELLDDEVVNTHEVRR